MKSKRRHELQTNELADSLGHFVDRVRPYLPTILASIVGLFAILFVWQWMAGSREQAKEQAWAAYMAVSGNFITDDLGHVADDFADTAAGLWAAQTQADIEMEQGIRRLFEDRELAETSLKIAKQRYQQVIDDPKSAKIPMLLNRARLGLAQTVEAQNDLENAKELYSAVKKSAPDSVEGALAGDRLASLDNATTEGWYNWFANQRPAPPPAENSSQPGGVPGLEGTGLDALPGLDDLPDTPSSDFMTDSPSEESESTENEMPEAAGPGITGPEQSKPETPKTTTDEPKKEGE